VGVPLTICFKPVCCDTIRWSCGVQLLTELNDLPDPPSPAGSGVAGEEGSRQGFSRRLRAIGHLFEAEDESQEWPELHTSIRHARKAYQADGMMPDWAALEDLIGQVQTTR